MLTQTIEDYLSTRKPSNAHILCHTLDCIANRLRDHVPASRLVADSLMCYCIINHIISERDIARIQPVKNAKGNTSNRMGRLNYLIEIIQKPTKTS